MQGVSLTDQDDDIGSDDELIQFVQSDTGLFDASIADAIQFSTPDDDDEPVTRNVGDAIDEAIKTAEIPVSTAPAKREPITETHGFGKRRSKTSDKPKGTAPNVDEWMDFFSRIVIRFATEWYVDYVFRGVSEDSISDIDAAKLALTDEERDIIARPYAEFANKNPFLKKHGRQIIAFSDSFESTVILGKFYMRVNRIARKYRPERSKHRPTVKIRPERTHTHDERSGQSSQSANGSWDGPIPAGYPIVNPGGS